MLILAFTSANEPLDFGVDQLEELALELAHVLWIEPLAECGRARQVGEENGDDPSLLAIVGRVGRARRASSRSATPQAEQKVALAGCSNPQAGQARWSGAPHSLQKRAPPGLSAPQEAQTNPTRRVYGEGVMRRATHA
jgi:hypothetical protein